MQPGEPPSHGTRSVLARHSTSIERGEPYEGTTRGRGLAWGLVAASIALAALLSPASAHVTGDVDHLWNQHLKAKVKGLAYTKTQTYTKAQANNLFRAPAYYDCCVQGAVPDTATDAVEVTVPSAKSYVIQGYVNVTGGSSAAVSCTLEGDDFGLDSADIDFNAAGDETTMSFLAGHFASGTAGTFTEYSIECTDTNTGAAYSDVRIMVERVEGIETP